MTKLRFNRSQLYIPYAVFLILFVIAPLVAFHQAWHPLPINTTPPT